MNTIKLYSDAEKMARNAKPGIIKQGGKIYTLVFNQSTWNYDIFENMFLLVSFNTKKLTQAKKWLRDYLNN